MNEKNTEKMIMKSFLLKIIDIDKELSNNDLSFIREIQLIECKKQLLREVYAFNNKGRF